MINPAIDFKSAFESMPGYSALLATDAPYFTVLAVTNEYLTPSKKLRKDVIGKSLFKAFPLKPNESNSFSEKGLIDSFQSVIREKLPHQLPVHRYDVETGDSGFREFYWQVCNKPVFDENGNVTAIIHSVEDISDKINAGEKDQKIKGLEMAHNIFMHIPEGIYILKGPQLIIELANEPALKLLGRETDIIGRPLMQAFPELEGQGFEELLLKVMATGQPHKAEDTPIYLVRNGTPEVVYFNYSYQPYYEDDADTPAGVLIFAYDVNDKVHAFKKIAENEKRYRTLIEEATVATALYYGPEIRIQYSNEIMLKYWGKKADIIGMRLEDAVPELKSQPFLKLLENVFLTGKPYIGNEEKATLEIDGELQDFYFNYNYKPLRDTNGNIYAIHHTAIDVTESVVAKAELQRSEHQLRSIFENVPFPVGIYLGADFKIAFANNAILKIWDLHDSEIIGRRYEEILPLDDKKRVLDIVSDVYNSGVPYFADNQRFELKTSHGKQIYFVNHSFIPLRDPDEKIYGIMSTAVDVTDMNLAKIKIEQSEKQFRQLADSLPEMVWTTDKNGNYTFASKRWEEFTGIDPYQDGAFVKVLHPDDLENVFKAWENSLKTGEIYKSEARLRAKDGSFSWFHIAGEPVAIENGEIEKWVGAFTNINDQKKAEEELKSAFHRIEESEKRFKSVANSAPVMIWMVDSEGSCNYLNRSWQNFTGRTLEEETGNGWKVGVHPDDFERCSSVFCAAMANQEEYYMEYRHKRHDGVYRWVSDNGMPRKTPDGKFEGFTGASMDIHDQKLQSMMLEEMVEERTRQLSNTKNILEQKNADLEKMNKELESFAYISSHDLQEPLRKIQTFASRVIESEYHKLSDNAKSYFERMQHAAHRMQILIDDLLAYSRTSSEDRNFETVNLKEIVDEIVDELQEDIQVYHATVETGDMCDISVIPFQFRQLMHNLIGNALKFSRPERSPHVYINSTVASGESLVPEKLKPDVMYCHIQVSDNGIGFQDEFGEKIFEVFQRLHGKEKYSGTGIGLAIVKKIVENHGGYIKAVGELNKGATFNIYIPSEH